MTNSAIFTPFLTMILLTFVVWLYMYVRRIHFLTSHNIDAQTLIKPRVLEDLTPPAVANPSDNLKNLFEMPVLFYALLLYLNFTNQVDNISLTAAWVFVVFRVLHSLVHCTFNLVMLRFYLYLIASCSVWFMAIRAVLNQF